MKKTLFYSFTSIFFLITFFLGSTKQASAQVTACSSSFSPAPIQNSSGLTTFIYTETGTVDDGQGVYTANNAPNGYNVITSGDTITATIKPNLGNNQDYSNSSNPIYSSIDFETLKVEICDSSGCNTTRSGGLLTLNNGGISFSLPSVNRGGENISFNLKGTKNGNPVNLCTQQNVVFFNDLTAGAPETGSASPPSCSDFNVTQTGEALNAQINLSAFDNNDLRTYQMRFGGSDIATSDSFKSNSECCINSSCPNGTGSDLGPFSIIRSCEQSHLTMQISDITNQAYNGGVVGLYSITRSAESDGAPVPSLICSYDVTVDQDTNEVIIDEVKDGSEVPDGPTPFTICGQLQNGTPDWKACDTCDKKDGIWTAIGCISSDPGKMIAVLVRVGINIGGGVALLMILAAGFMFSTSQGDPNKVKEAKELMQSAIIGLLFIIFSVTILQFIGVSILQIPGFGGA